ncbi:hypothetical protein CPB83DRAFT_859483 [Crepidotus variabilis]|uniref:BTB domain-containing protein n=1 Tax=Crepidotus variabilis TaxID=179855 RepID=A0A9P6EAB8_9AGAR|nr:hypothetical protein CPB83DRAFT_859483 [Crepidotus variabilis]
MPKTMDTASGSADLIFQSSDGTKFPVHRKNVQSMAGAFPIPETTTPTIVTQLPEPAKVLEVVFQFVYPKRLPSLDDRDFDLLMEIAKAVEKYEVFSAMQACTYAFMNARFKGTHSADILAFAIKYEYPQLADSAAEDLLFFDAIHTAEKLPDKHLLLWLKYRKAGRKAIFGSAEEKIDTMKMDLVCSPSLPYPPTNQYGCCHCRDGSTRWMKHLKRISSRSALTEEILGFSDYQFSPNTSVKCSCLKKRRCMHLSEVAGLVKKGLEQIPSFTDFRRGLDEQNEGAQTKQNVDDESSDLD